MQEKETSSSLLLAVIRVLACTAALSALVLISCVAVTQLDAGLWLLIGVAGAEILVLLQTHPTRILGLVPYGATGLVLALSLTAFFTPVPAWLCAWLGISCVLVYMPLFSADEEGLPGMSVLAILLLIGLSAWRGWLPGSAWSLMITLAALGAVLAWWAFLRDAYELTLEILTFPFFRIRGHGPGLAKAPPTGPLLVIANHTAWFDPIWLGKVFPRRLTGMLTSAFFDLPVLHFLATKIVPTIRVADSRYRREAPELQDAIAALDRGESVLLFPEGQMRKREDKPLHPFGRGVWHILRERPRTPVVVCWIEGGWGSFASYKDGPPAKNKRFDWWRRIDVAVCEPAVVDPAILEDHRATRNHLREKVLNARQHLGLEPLRQPELMHTSEAEA